MQRNRRACGLLVSVTAALFALGANAQEAVSNFTLDNGMDIVVIEDRRAPAAVHMVWYRAGSADEDPGVSGVAHFLEHLMFKGTKTLDPGAFSARVAANGGTDNAFTSFDTTAYFQRVAADRLGLMMEMEADRMVNLSLTEDDILTERDVIIEERNQRVDNDPGALFSEQRRAALYLNHPYGTPIIGWRHEMEQLNMQDVLAFYDRHYAPNNAILVVAGDVDPQTVLDLAQRHYGPIPAKPDIARRDRRAEPPHLAERRVVMQDPRVAQPYLMRSYLAPERDSGAQETAAALTVLAEILGGGQTALLSRALQFDTQTAVYTSAWYSATSLDDSNFTMVVVPGPGVSLEQAEAAMDATLQQFLSDGVDPEQLERIKFQLRAQQIYAQDSANGLARRYGRALTSGLTIADVQAWPDVLQAVSGEDVIAAARAVFNRDRSVTGYLSTAPVTEATQ